MCNDFGNRIPYDDYLKAFSQIRLPVVFPTAAPNLEPRDDIWPTELAPVIRRRRMASSWCNSLGLPAGPPESNRHQLPLRRTTVPERPLPDPGLALFEFTGKKSPKSKWKFTKPMTSGSASPACGGQCRRASASVHAADH